VLWICPVFYVKQIISKLRDFNNKIQREYTGIVAEVNIFSSRLSGNVPAFEQCWLASVSSQSAGLPSRMRSPLCRVVVLSRNPLPSSKIITKKKKNNELKHL
jgi:hypothetical protein